MKRKEGNLDGVGGVKKVGVKDLSYKMVFIACSVATGDTRFGFANNNATAEGNEEETTETLAAKFTGAERARVADMKQQDNLYTKLANSIAPSVHGHTDVKKGILLQLFGGV